MVDRLRTAEFRGLFAQPLRSVQKYAQRFIGRRDFEGVFIGIHAHWKTDSVAFNTDGLQPLRVLARSSISSFVTVVGQVNALRFMRFEGLQMLIVKALGAIDASDLAEAVDPKGERIDDRFRQDDAPLLFSEPGF